MFIKSLKQIGLENTTTLQSYLLRVTCSLVRIDHNYKFQGFASGFIVERSGSLFLLSAGHALKKDGWCIETGISFEDTNETLLIPLNNVLTFKTFSLDTMVMEDIDFAFARLDIGMLRREAFKDERVRKASIDFTTYNGPLDHEPAQEIYEYSYAAWKRWLVSETSKMFLHHGATGEFGMAFKGRSSDGKLYCFTLPDHHKNHDYYRGASGSPITDSEGKVVSLLLGGNISTNTLYGLPLKDYVQLLDIEL